MTCTHVASVTSLKAMNLIWKSAVQVAHIMLETLFENSNALTLSASKDLA